jgi:hypothetical protein
MKPNETEWSIGFLFKFVQNDAKSPIPRSSQTA